MVHKINGSWWLTYMMSSLIYLLWAHTGWMEGFQSGWNGWYKLNKEKKTSGADLLSCLGWLPCRQHGACTERVEFQSGYISTYCHDFLIVFEDEPVQRNCYYSRICTSMVPLSPLCCEHAQIGGMEPRSSQSQTWLCISGSAPAMCNVRGGARGGQSSAHVIQWFFRWQN